MRSVDFLRMDFSAQKQFLDAKVAVYNRPDFIEYDPISIPHRFSQKQDIEIAAFFAAILAWGQRKTIINKCSELMNRMGGQPYQFVLHHSEQDLKNLLGFKHRTFNDTDLLYFIAFFKMHYSYNKSLETAFIPQADNFRSDYMSFEDSGSDLVQTSGTSSTCYAHELAQTGFNIEKALNHFRAYFFSLPDYPERTLKHISSPFKGSTCKRINMFLRWMVRNDNQGIDFGLWQIIRPSQLICPCDVHVERVARHLGLIERKQTDWRCALELSAALRTFDPNDPVKYDFALFGLGVEGLI